METNHPIKQALMYLKQADTQQALRVLLQYWPTYKATEVADLIDSLSQEMCHERPAVADEGDAPADIDTKWMNLAKRRDVVDLGPLLAMLHHGSIETTRKWFDELDNFGLDPRIPRTVIDVADSYGSSSAGPLRTRALNLVAKVGDARSLAVLQKIEQYLSSRPQIGHAPSYLRKIRAVMSTITPPPHLTPQDNESVVLLRAEIAQLHRDTRTENTKEPVNHDEESLLQQIYTTPEDDAPRLIYADWLNERGRPLGEFIVLQCWTKKKVKGAKAEQRALLKTNQEAWLGPLLPIIRKGTAKFERGFLHQCSIVTPAGISAYAPKLVGHPMWSTVKVFSGSHDFYLHPVMKNLLELRVPRDNANNIASLCQLAEPRPLEVLRFRHSIGDDAREAFLALSKQSSLPKLRLLDLRGDEYNRDTYDDIDKLFASPLGQQLTEMHIRGTVRHVTSARNAKSTCRLVLFFNQTLINYRPHALIIEPEDGFTKATLEYQGNARHQSEFSLAAELDAAGIRLVKVIEKAVKTDVELDDVRLLRQHFQLT